MNEEPLTARQTTSRAFDSAYAYWRVEHDAMAELRAFTSGRRYEDDLGEFNRDRRTCQIRGQDTQDTVSHVVGQLTSKPRNILGKPKDTESDPAAAELFAALVAGELDDTWKNYDGEDYKALVACHTQRLGVVFMDVEEWGPFGREIIFSWEPSDKVTWDPCYDPHHPLCGWMRREYRMDVDKARTQYKAPWLVPDRTAATTIGTYQSGRPLLSQYAERVQQNLTHDDNKITLVQWWFKNDQTVAKNAELSDTQPLAPDDRYMACTQGCGYRSHTQGVLKRQGAIQNGLPEMIDMACPQPLADGTTCGGDLERIDARDVSHEKLAYTSGHRLIVEAPFCPNPDDLEECLYDGAWPVPKARSFPAQFYFASIEPGRAFGKCLVDLMWDNQVAQDNLDTQAIQAVFSHRDYWFLPETGIFDRERRRFEFRDDQFNVGFRDATVTNLFGNQPIEHIQGTGVDPNWGMVRQVINANLMAYRPKADIGISQSQAADVPVGTTEMRVEQSEVSTEDFRRRRNMARSQFAGVLSDYIVGTYTPDRIAALNIDNADIIMRMYADSLPNHDFMIEDTPTFSGIDKAKSAAFDQAMNAAMQYGPEGFQAWAEFHQVPRSVADRISKILEARDARMAAKSDAADAANAGLGGAPGGPGMGAGSPPGAPNAGANAGGMGLPVAA